MKYWGFFLAGVVMVILATISRNTQPDQSRFLPLTEVGGLTVYVNPASISMLQEMDGDAGWGTTAVLLRSGEDVFVLEEATEILEELR